MISEKDLVYLKQAVDLARIALDKGDEPFGSLLVSHEGDVLFKDHNHVAGGDNTRHPEFEIARWAAQNMTEENRKLATVYTSGEHCPMCAAAHGWVGLGRIVYACSSQQLVEWGLEYNWPVQPVKALPIQEIIPEAIVEGPAEGLCEEVKQLHIRSHQEKSNRV